MVTLNFHLDEKYLRLKNIIKIIERRESETERERNRERERIRY
jgi:hypothetical protein